MCIRDRYPLALKRVADLVDASSWAADFLTRHPLLLDELLDPRLLEIAMDWDSFRANVQRSLSDHCGGTEREMEILREMHHAQIFRLLVQDLGGLHTIERISDHLTQLADILVHDTIPVVWGNIRKRHCEIPKFAVIGYGKLGGKELGLSLIHI